MKFYENLPKAVPFILCSIFLERLASGAISAVMSLFFNQKLGFDPSHSTALFHAYECLVFSFTIVGAIIADKYLGLYKTLVPTSFVYAAGAGIIAIAAIEPLNLPINALVLVGLITAVIGVGSVKSNSNVFAANQYKLPEQAAQLSLYFSLQYFCMKSGSIIGRIFNPILRQDVQCFKMNDCFPLAFGVPAMAMIVSMLILIAGRSHYTHKPRGENMFVKVCACIFNGIKEKFKRHKIDPKDHWLDYSQEKLGLKFVGETKMILSTLLMFVPIPVFWTLHMQQGSRWVFQATRMNGDISWFTIKPDQMIVFNSIFSLVLVPIFERVIYPLMAKVGMNNPLAKMSVGMFFAAASFVVSALNEIQIEKAYINILWLVPQYFLLVIGEIMVFVQNLNFAYREAPENMKSVMLSFVYLTTATGNLFMVFISGTKLFESQVHEFLFFAGVMFVDMLIFIALSINYKYTSHDDDDKVEK